MKPSPAMSLLQLWDVLVPKEKRPLGVLLLGSLALHISVFFIFKIDPIPPTIGAPSQPRVSLVSSESSAGTDLNAWFEIFDPSMIALPSSKPEPRTLHPIEHQAETFPDLPHPPVLIPFRVTLPTLNLSLPPLPQRAETSIARRLETLRPMPLEVETPPPLSGTEVQLDRPLSQRDVTRRTALPQPQTTLALAPTILRLAVNAEGIPVHALILESSGDSAVDRLALENLKNWRFKPLENDSEQSGFQWSRATVFWDTQPLSGEAHSVDTEQIVP
jgi:TonB family protein